VGVAPCNKRTAGFKKLKKGQGVRGEGFTSEDEGRGQLQPNGEACSFRAREADGLALGAALELAMQKTTWAVAALELVRQPWTVGGVTEDGVGSP
jgi:hypothetical protein